MILSDRTIRQMLSDHSLVISPLTEDQIQPVWMSALGIPSVLWRIPLPAF